MDALAFSDVTKTYGAITALDGVSFTVNRGEMFGVIGPDGAGKTTAIRIACGLLRADGGRVSVLGHDPVKDHRQVTGTVGYLSQRFSLYGDLTIDEPGALQARLSGRLYEVIAAAMRPPLDLLRSVPGVADAQSFGDRAHVTFAPGTTRDTAGDLRTRLEREGIQVTSVRPIGASLEDVFIAMLGQPAHEMKGLP
jgi:ABC-type Na+ transport system ATPase subunit NatA